MINTVRFLKEDIGSMVEDDKEQQDCDDEEFTMSIVPTVPHMRCSVHIIQFAVKDGVKREGNSVILNLIRYLVKNMKSSNVLAFIRKKTNKLPILDYVTRGGAQSSCWIGSLSSEELWMI
ncbi:unnamed protein product [Lepeophtheirus salmonis]|uniref:(salmon louse) hypothetical protein n=1 Tax=Lepeophtheirus salmonis TaxID=72036 RepID=A0A817F9E0_LEPSM|nr:unnamed protein product [Lepeophtheirus salmonis]CAG9475335.1 unnamed protein product [Lepeophtheirus salmonis]